MFWLYVLLRPRRRHVTVNHVRWEHPRFHRAWYWLTGAFLAEAVFWLAAAEMLALWWLAWLAAKGIAALVARFWYVPIPAADTIAACRPLWPRAQLNGATPWII